MTHQIFDELRTGGYDKYVTVDHDNMTISFKIQKGPVKENGVNGCQIDTMIVVCRHILMALNVRMSSPFNRGAIYWLGMALKELKKRTAHRKEMGVEGEFRRWECD